MPETLRAFIAVNIPEPMVLFVKAIQDDLRANGVKAKWVRAENIHITLKFLGNVRTDAVASVRDALSTMSNCSEPATLYLKGMGVFPGIRKTRVIWAGIDGDTARLYHLQRQLEDELERIGFEKDKKKFRAHLTIARVKQRVDSRALLSGIEKYKDRCSDAFSVDRLILYKSDLRPSGPIYRVIDTFML